MRKLVQHVKTPKQKKALKGHAKPTQWSMHRNKKLREQSIGKFLIFNKNWRSIWPGDWYVLFWFFVQGLNTRLVKHNLLESSNMLYREVLANFVHDATVKWARQKMDAYSATKYQIRSYFVGFLGISADEMTC